MSPALCFLIAIVVSCAAAAWMVRNATNARRASRNSYRDRPFDYASTHNPMFQKGIVHTGRGPIKFRSKEN